MKIKKNVNPFFIFFHHLNKVTQIVTAKCSLTSHIAFCNYNKKNFVVEFYQNLNKFFYCNQKAKNYFPRRNRYNVKP